MLFGFVPYREDVGFFTAVFDARRGLPPDRVGPSVQLPVGDEPKMLRAAGRHLELAHFGALTVGRGAVRRATIAELAVEHASDALALLEWAEPAWPMTIGTTADLDGLIDRAFLYSYAMEQAKRAVTRDPVLARDRAVRARPALPPLDAPDRADEIVSPASTTKQGYALTHAQRTAVAERAVELASEVYRARGTPSRPTASRSTSGAPARPRSSTWRSREPRLLGRRSSSPRTRSHTRGRTGWR
jgi:hypothetical protein